MHWNQSERKRHYEAQKQHKDTGNRKALSQFLMKGRITLEREYLSRESDVLELAIPIVFAFNHAASVELSALQLYGHDVSCGFV